MGKFGKGKRFGDRFGDNKFGGGRPAMHSATCGECGKPCQVPFKPTGDRPVFCDVCFGKKGAIGTRSKFGGERHERRERRDFSDRQMHDAICSKCGKSCQVPFRPTAGKTVFCDNCFDKGGAPKTGDNNAAQFKMLNEKLDKLIKILTPSAPVMAEKKSEEKVEKKVEKKAVKKIAKAKTAVKKTTAKKVVTKKK